MRSHKGITLIALVVTIVVLLILAGTSIAMLRGDNGIVTQAQKAKEQTTIAKEKESISLAKGAIRSRGEEVEKDNLQEELDKIEGEGKTEVTLKEDLSGLEIKFIDTDNKYEEGVTIEVSEEEQSYWTYEDNPDGTITLLKYNPPAENSSGLTELVVPNNIFGKRVKSIGSKEIDRHIAPVWGDNISEYLYLGSTLSTREQSSIKNIIIKENIDEINPYAFAYGNEIQNITIQNGITSIGENAFLRCSNLKSITIPNSVTSIKSGVFEYCTSLMSVNIPDGITNIESSVFNGCSSLISIYIPDSVTDIKSNAFNGCSSLTSINIPNSVTSIENGVFSNCSSLTSINIPDSVTIMGNDVFSECSGLTTINLEASEIPSTWDSNWKRDCAATVNTGVKM